MPVEFKLPELGENVEKGDVVRVLVSAGDVVAKDQPVLELETDKATIEVPSSIAGRVSEVKVKVGDKVKVGQTVLVVSDDAAESKDAPAAPPAAPAAESEQTAKPEQAAKPAKPAAGDTRPAASTEAKAESAREAIESQDEPIQAPHADVVDIATARHGAAAAASAAPAPARVEGSAPVPAAPSARRYARELGVEIGAVPGTGPGGRIGQDDIKQHVKERLSGGGGGVVGRAAGPLPDFTKWGEVDVQPMSNIRRKTAEHLSIAWQAPHVTQHDKADVTAFEEFRETYGRRVEKAGGKLTVTAILIKILAIAVKKYPQFASSVDMANQSIVLKNYCHIGVAVDTPNGLLVPVIRDADRKSVTDIAVDLATLSQKARDKKLSLDDMSGGVFSISNLGGIGGTAFTPLINQPEVAILGVSRGAVEPVWQDDEQEFEPREMLPLSLSYDHRVIDGADAARFLRFVAEALEHPMSVYL
ncbi:MAG: 2-oxo acid dehydrogenase subunit E2 [Vicinamibacterales bacterium]